MPEGENEGASQRVRESGREREREGRRGREREGERESERGGMHSTCPSIVTRVSMHEGGEVGKDVRIQEDDRLRVGWLNEFPLITSTGT